MTNGAETAPPSLLQGSGLVKAYHHRRVVDGVSIEIGVQPAEVLYALNVLLAHGVLDTYAPPPQPVAKEVLYEVTAR